ncbi:hypothetical protein CDAR_275201 [Caerostris darwini]|uniref:Uncharacterized protein n=1 Tax=Caerostris darwini TaxID=1538125 RepID=A0AAV4VWD3_9ARAC|nr:hypothetical protein CDAR_275201 [Caerostris darwini]
MSLSSLTGKTSRDDIDNDFPVEPRLSRINGRPGISRSFRILQKKKTPRQEVVWIGEKRGAHAVPFFGGGLRVGMLAEGTKRFLFQEGGGGDLGRVVIVVDREDLSIRTSITTCRFR